MDMNDIHALFLPAAIEAARRGASAKDLRDYLEAAAKGMGVNAAFALSGPDMVAILEGELTD